MPGPRQQFIQASVCLGREREFVACHLGNRVEIQWRRTGFLAGPPQAAMPRVCVCQGTKGTLVQAMTGSWPSPPPVISLPPCTLLHSRCQVAEDSPEIDTHNRPVHVKRVRQVKSLARRAAGWDSCYPPAWFMPCPVEQICVSIHAASFQPKQVPSAGLRLMCEESCWAKSGHEEDFFLPQVPSLSHPSVSPLLLCGGGDLQAVEGGVAE